MSDMGPSGELATEELVAALRERVVSIPFIYSSSTLSTLTNIPPASRVYILNQEGLQETYT